MKTKEEIAKEANLDLIDDEQINLIAPFLKNSTLPPIDTTVLSCALIGKNDTSFRSISQNLPALLSEGKNKSIYVLDDGHWLGLYYKAEEKKLYFIDSYGHDYKDYEKTTAQIQKSLEAYPDITIENLYKQKIQFAEVDKNNCGRFVGMTLVLLDSGVKPEEFQRLGSPIINEIVNPRITNASLELAAKIDRTLFSESQTNVDTTIAPIRLKQALKEYMAVVNDEVRKNIIGMTNEIIETLAGVNKEAIKESTSTIVNDEVRTNTIEKTTDMIYTLADTDEQQAKKLIMGLQDFVESPNRHNAERLNKILDETNTKLHLSNSENQAIDKDGFSKYEIDQAIKASLKSANSEVKQSSLKEKFHACQESLRLFINTIGTSISSKFNSSPEKSPSSKSR
jgi:hypothetical protein